MLCKLQKEKKNLTRLLYISQQEIPVIGYDKWFKLEPRSSASKVQGECHLILRLFTNQVELSVYSVSEKKKNPCMNRILVMNYL